ncbi:hypothetical protein ALC57_00389 [Trachymyrmex cornetzi]|uniref:Uncharacterized protein n=1 Tax=Trachymyrmex cornetzi TaxID=471704 RepID=A0A151JRY4_9HYME|nr:hypothetical protein ALC57_00389 [Trachymyrmex cornetzi]
MANLFNLVLSSSDDDEEQFRRRSKFKQRINYFDELDDIEFKMRFRLNKQSVLLILEEIRQVLEFVTNRLFFVSQRFFAHSSTVLNYERSLARYGFSHESTEWGVFASEASLHEIVPLHQLCLTVHLALPT